MMTTRMSYADWCKAVKAEYDKLDACRFYLNADGEERRRAYFQLWDMSNYCTGPEELLAWIDDKEGLNKQDIEALNSAFAIRPINFLRSSI